MSEKTSLNISIFPVFSDSSMATTWLPSHLAPRFITMQPAGLLLSHHVTLYLCASLSHQATPKPDSSPSSPVEWYSSIKESPPGPGLHVSSPCPPPPLGNLSLGSILMAIDHVPENALTSFSISGPGCGRVDATAEMHTKIATSI